MLVTTLVAQTAAKKPVKKAAAAPAVTAEDVQALRDALAGTATSDPAAPAAVAADQSKPAAVHSNNCSKRKAQPRMRQQKASKSQAQALSKMTPS
jgi:hypothetical protein